MNYSQDIIWIKIKDDMIIDNNLNINNNPMVPLTSINYNSNQHRESFPYELCKYSTQLLQRDGVVMMVLVEMMVWMMMMIPMKTRLMMVLMATISPLREGVSPIEICLPERSFSLGVFRPAEAEEIYLWSPPGIRVLRGRYRREGGVGSQPCGPH